LSDSYDDENPPVVDVEAEHGDPAEAGTPGGAPQDSEDPGIDFGGEGMKWQVVWGPGRKSQPKRGWLIPTLLMMLLVGHGYRMAWDGSRWFHLFDPKQALLGFLYGGIIFGICHLAWVLVGLLPRALSALGGITTFVTILWLGSQSCAACVFGAPAGQRGPLGGFMGRLGVAAAPATTSDGTRYRVVSTGAACTLAPVGGSAEQKKTFQLRTGSCSQAVAVGDQVYIVWVGGRKMLVPMGEEAPSGSIYPIKD